MADYQRAVEEIRFFLQGADQTLRDEVREWAETYAEAVREANERLRRCKEFLNQNLRSEAIHVADADPNLMEMVSYLDFAELKEWEEFCADHTLTAPPKVLLLVAEDLNQAYAMEQPLKQHLRRLRRLALVRAPLDQRLAVMRKLAELDAESHFWREDIAEFELARHRELEDEARAAAARGDADRLKALVQELQSDKWLQPPSEELLANVKRSYVKVTRSSGRERLEQLAPQLIEAAQQGDVDRARRLRSEWEQTLREARLGPDDPLARDVAPAFDWIAQHDQHAAAEAAFQMAVSTLMTELNKGDRAAVTELERLRQGALAYGRPLPPEVEARYSSTVDRIHGAANWNRRLFLTGTVAGLLVVVGLMVFFVVTGMRGSALRSATERLQALIEAGDLDAATKFRAELRDQSPELLTAQPVIPLLDRLAKLEEEDRARADKFALHLETARKFLDRGMSAEATRELDDAEKIAKRSHEGNEIKKLRDDITIAGADRTKDNVQKVVEAAATAGAKLDAAEKSLDRQEFGEAATLLSEVREIVSKARELAVGASGDAADRLKLVQTRLDSQQSRLAAAREANLLETRIAEAVATLCTHPTQESLARYEALLQEYADKYPNSPRSAGYRQTRGELGLTRGALRWGDELRPLTTVESLVRVSHTVADNRSKLCQDLLRTYPGSPDAARIRNYQTFLASIARQAGAVATLQLVFNNALLKDVWQIRQGDKRWYSTDGTIADSQVSIQSRLEAGASSVHFYYVFTDDARKKEAKLQVAGKPTTCLRAPQTALSAKVLDQLGKLRVAPDWERGLVDVLQLIERDAETDPLLRVILLSSVLQRGAEASTVFQQASEPQLRAIQNSGINLVVAWMDPEDARANEARAKAVQLLSEKLPPLSDIPPLLDKARDATAQPLLTRYEVVGALHHGGDGSWSCRIDSSRLSTLPDVNLAVIATSGGAQAGLWKTIGSLSQGQATVRAEAADLVEGRLVFGVQRVAGRGR